MLFKNNSNQFIRLFLILILSFFAISNISYLHAFSIEKSSNNVLENDVLKNIQQARAFNTTQGFVQYVSQNQDPSHNVVSFDDAVKNWDMKFNMMGTSKKTFDNFVIDQVENMIFKHIQKGENYEMYSSVVPFTLEIRTNKNKYPDEIKVIQNGTVGVNNVTIIGDKVSTELVNHSKPRIIEKGTKPYIQLKDESDYDAKTVKKDLQKLKLKVALVKKHKPKSYKVKDGVANYKLIVEDISSPNINRLKQNSKVVVTVGYEKVSKLAQDKLRLKKDKKKLASKLNSYDIFDQELKNSYKNRIKNIKSIKKLLKLKKEISSKAMKLEMKKVQEEQNALISSSSGSLSSTSEGAINKDAPKVSNGTYGMPLADLTTTQYLHDGLAVDYQSSGCFNHPGCVPVYAIADGVVSTSSAGAYGNAVVISHNSLGTCSRYAHLNSFNVSNGESVKKGDVIGMMGTTGNSTGVHLHFELRQGSGGCFGTMINPHDYGM